MSALETREDLSEDKAGREEGSDVRLVPVGESIRYRRRAQSAEKRAEELAEELAQTRAEATRLNEDLRAAQQERELVGRLAAEGVRDLEAAVLIAKARLADGDASDMKGVIEQLKREKQYLFSESRAAGAAVRTSPGKERAAGAEGALARAGKRAAASGSRMDLQEYMRKRRGLN